MEESHRDAILGGLRAISTRNQWSLLHNVLTQLNRRLKKPITGRELGALLHAIPDEELNCFGIWVQFFGSGFAPIICINPAFGRANDRDGVGRPCKCQRNQTDDASPFFTSHNYNIGRHESAASSHIVTCSKWQPPSAGHLHSWRRGYD